jgi:hypothetical protein
MSEITAEFGTSILKLLEREIGPLKKKIAELEMRLQKQETRARIAIFARKEKKCNSKNQNATP